MRLFGYEGLSTQIARARLRVQDQAKWPRRWWWPIASVVAEASAGDAQRDHDQVSRTVQRVLLVLVGYSFFCIVTLAAPDRELLDKVIRVPFATVQVGITAFLIVGPGILIALVAYLQIFLEHLHNITRTQHVHPLPFVFNLSGTVPSLVSQLLFYWLLPFVLLVFVYKASPLANTSPLVVVTALATLVLLGLQIRRYPEEKRSSKRYRVLWLGWALLLIYSIVSSIRALPELTRKNGPRGWQRGISVPYTDLRSTRLRGLDLTGAVMTGSNLEGADLWGIDLTNADLMFADLRSAKLTRSKLVLATLEGADLRGANMEGAVLRGAYFGVADLRGAVGLTCEQLTTGVRWEVAFRDDDLACGATIPER